MKTKTLRTHLVYAYDNAEDAAEALDDELYECARRRIREVLHRIREAYIAAFNESIEI